MAKKHDVIAIVASLVIMTIVWVALGSWTVRDFVQGLGYEPSTAVAEIRNDLELTGQGQRIFQAARPALETSENFNIHCDSHNREVALLGCYTDGRIYVYEITNSDLADANKVTMAHELLHAAWLRMSEGEKNKVINLMNQVAEANTQEWLETELSAYEQNSDVLTEEKYVRIGTKVRDLPEELEQHYAKYFQNRARIVDFYENYQAPFTKLKAETEQLEKEILAERDQIAADRDKYVASVESLNRVIQNFNDCANRAGCFTSDATFQAERRAIDAERVSLENQRTSINERIDQTNAKFIKYQQNLQMLGELSDAMNSNAIESI